MLCLAVLLAACGGGGGGGGGGGPTVDISGSWSGNWQSNFGPGGTISAAVTQSDGAISGTGTIVGSLCFAGLTMSGTASGNSVSMSGVSGTESINFSATSGATFMQGTYSVAGISPCAGDSGTFSASKDMILYDDFTDAGIDLTKWSEDVDAGGTISIVSNAFQADLIANGGLQDNDARLEMAAAGDPGSVTGLEVRMNVSEATETSGGIRARLQGTFYNDGTVMGAAPGSSTSEILAIMQITGFGGTATGTASYVVVRCTNADCTTNDTVASSPLGTVQLSVNHTFRMEFDRNTSTFTFRMDGGTPDTVNAAASGAPFSTGPNNPVVNVGIRGRLSPDGTMTATFDDFRCRGCVVP